MHIDFETEHPKGIHGLTTEKYARECRVLCFVYDEKLWLPGDPVPEELIEHIHLGGLLYAHNASFERLVWRHQLLPLGFPEVPDHQWYCTMAACRTLAVPASLENAGLFLGLDVLKGDSKIMKRLSKPGNYGFDEYAQLYSYCKQDVRAETALSRKLRPLQEHRLWCYTEKMNDRGLPIDVELAVSAAQLWETYSADLNRQFKEATGFRANQTAEVLKLFKGMGLDLGELSKQTLDRVDVGRYGELVRLRREAAQAAPSKFKSLVRNVVHGRIHSTLIFHGAKTGRWTGSVFQPQNLMRGCVPHGWVPAMRTMIINQDIDSIQMAFESPAEAIGSMVRPCIRADKLICCDFAAIEARGSAWMAGCKPMLKAFKEKKDVYVEMAKAIYGRKDLTPENKTERFFGKTAVLGCNYGLGAQKFMEQCDGYGVQIPLEFAQNIVRVYRRTYPEIQSWWYDLEDAFNDVVVGVSKSVEVGPLVVYRRDKHWICIKLPSGRDLSYLNCRIGAEGSITYDGFNQAGKKWAERTWGGKLTENCLMSDSSVLTPSGWKPIIEVAPDDLVHDGVGWVSHGGVIFKGHQEVGQLDGVSMTPDHKVLTDGKTWIEASQCKGFTWRGVRLPDGHAICRISPPERRQDSQPLGGNMRLRKQGSTHLQRNEKKAWAGDSVLRLHVLGADGGRTENPRHDQPPRFLGMEIDARQMPTADASSISQLWRTRDFSLQSLEGFRELLGRHGFNVSTGVNAGPHRQRRQLLQKELSMGNSSRAVAEQTQLCGDGCSITGGRIGGGSNNGLQTHSSGLERRPNPVPVYDILDCGPLNRFVVQGESGPFVVHNCVSGMCRDVMVDAMYRLEKHGYEVILTVHDEILVEGKPHQSAQEMQEIMCGTVPEWARGLPVDGEAWEGEFYRK